MNLKGRLEVAGRSDPGLLRSHNEDSIGSDLDIGVVVLADGMGGYKGGEVASAIAVNTAVDYLKSVFDESNPDTSSEIEEHSGYTTESVAARQAIIKANEAIFQTAKSQPQYEGMGTTIVLTLFYDNRLTVAHVGDSRLYRLRERAMEQITVDHTLLQELVDRGFYTEKEAQESPNKNLVTRALGVEQTVAVDLIEDLALPGDLFLLCSDGLYDMVADEEIRLTLLKDNDNLESLADRLIELANANGGKDNISVMLVRPLKPFPVKQSWYSKVTDWFN